MEGSEVAHHLFIHILLVSVDCLGVLAKVVESGEMFSTVAVERTFPGVFSDESKRGLGRVMGVKGGQMVPDVSRQMLTPAEDHSTVTVAPALESFGGGRTITLVDPGAGDVGEVVDR